MPKTPHTHSEGPLAPHSPGMAPHRGGTLGRTPLFVIPCHPNLCQLEVTVPPGPSCLATPAAETGFYFP